MAAWPPLMALPADRYPGAFRLGAHARQSDVPLDRAPRYLPGPLRDAWKRGWRFMDGCAA
jgi:hypothetical protein